MESIDQCYICGSEHVSPDSYEDWDDIAEVEIIREGYYCDSCRVFHYEENDRVVCIIAHKEETTSSLNGYIPEI